MEAQQYLAINRALWDAKTPHHLTSEFYDMPSFMAGKTSLNDIELRVLGDVKGKSVLHLQCHFGQDTLSLSRMGAEATGIDLSGTAIEKAIEINEQLGLNATFLCTDVYALPDVLDKQFDIVFTSYGTIGWLPDIAKWAGVVSHFLKPGGKFVFAEFHPAVWMFDNDFQKITYSYFNAEPIFEEEEGTYADSGAPIKLPSVGWNHSLGEVLGELLGNGLTLSTFEEVDYSPYNCFRNSVKIATGKFQIKGMEGKLPMVYALSMRK